MAVIRTMADTAVATLVFWAVSAAILVPAVGDGSSAAGLLGVGPAALFRSAGPVAYFRMATVANGGAVVTAALAERGSAAAGGVGAAVLAGVVVPVTGQWAWYAWLANWHFIAVGDGAVLHLSAAVAAGVAVVGGRTGKYAGGVSRSLPGHALPLVGWVPYLLGSAAAHATANGMVDDWPAVLTTAATNTLLAAAGGTVGALGYARVRFDKPDLFYAVAGMTGGLVAVSTGATALGNTGAVLVGAVAGVLVPAAAAALDGRAKLDDPVGSMAVHDVGGLWGTLAVPLLCPRRMAAGDTTAELVDRLRLLAVQLAVQMAGVVAVAAAVAFGLLGVAGWARVSPADEAAGLDAAGLGVVTYPEFTAAADGGPA